MCSPDGRNLTVVRQGRRPRRGGLGRAARAAPAAARCQSSDHGDALAGDLVVLAVYYPDARDAVEQHARPARGQAGHRHHQPAQRDVRRTGVPPDSSATQELAKLAPGARFVKAFNTTFAGTLDSGEVAGQPLDVLIAGDDEGAKAAVAALARDGGLNPIDAGPQHRARELEALGLLHISLQGSLGLGFGSAVKIVSVRSRQACTNAPISGCSGPPASAPTWGWKSVATKNGWPGSSMPSTPASGARAETTTPAASRRSTKVREARSRTSGSRRRARCRRSPRAACPGRR